MSNSRCLVEVEGTLQGTKFLRNVEFPEVLQPLGQLEGEGCGKLQYSLYTTVQGFSPSIYVGTKEIWVQLPDNGRILSVQELARAKVGMSPEYQGSLFVTDSSCPQCGEKHAVRFKFPAIVKDGMVLTEPVTCSVHGVFYAKAELYIQEMVAV